MMFLFSLFIIVQATVSKASQQHSSSIESSWKFNECPEKCECTMKMSEHFQAYLRTVDCSGQDLLDFPSSVPSDVQVLLLKDNKIRHIFDKPLYLHDLVHLDLAHNLIRSLGHDSRFRELYNMKVLDLSHNRITALRDYVFRGLFNLEDLNLSDNPILSMAEDCFKGLLKLETLRLSGNRLEYVHPSWWTNVRTLYNLYLDRNHFTFIQSEAFKSLRNLRRLDLGRNKIGRINVKALVGLEKLENLLLDYNSLTSTPRESFQYLRSSLKSLNLNRNPIQKLRTDDLANLLRLKDVSLNNMQRLKLVERGSFKNLPELLVVELHDNPHLNYLDALSFVNTPQISHILLHNNNLTVLNRQIVDASPILEEISFYGNPLACDCNSKWLKELLTKKDHSDRRRNLVFRDAERMVCDSPSEQKFKLFSVLRSDDLSDKCAPTIVQLFNSSNVRKSGEDIVYDCRSVGIPTPKITWLDPNGSPITASTYHPRRVLLNGDSLIIRRAQPEDSGRYTCVAENEYGNSIVHTNLNVTSMQIELNVRGVTDNGATLFWNGADLDHHVFQILYRSTQSLSNRRHDYAGTVASIMKTYRLENLRSNTNYEACIAFKDDFDVVVHISCVQFETRHSESAQVRIERTSNVAIGVALGIVASMLIVVCLSAVVLKARRYKTVDPLVNLENGAYMAASVDNLSRTYSTDNVVAPLVYNKLISNYNQAAHV